MQYQELLLSAIVANVYQ